MTHLFRLEFGRPDPGRRGRLALCAGLSVVVHAAAMLLLMPGAEAAARAQRRRELNARKLQRIKAAPPVDIAIGQTRFKTPAMAARTLVPKHEGNVPLKPVAADPTTAPPETESRVAEGAVDVPDLAPVVRRHERLASPAPEEKKMPSVRSREAVHASLSSDGPSESLRASLSGPPAVAMSKGRQGSSPTLPALHPRRSRLRDVLPGKKPELKDLFTEVQLDPLDVRLDEQAVAKSVPTASEDEKRLYASVDERGRERQADRPRFHLLVSDADLLAGDAVRLGAGLHGADGEQGLDYKLLGVYGVGLRKRMSRVGFYPAVAMERGYQGSVTVRFRVARDGSLLNARILIDAPFEILNQAALALVREAAPFAPFPKSIDEPAILFELEIEYSLQTNVGG